LSLQTVFYTPYKFWLGNKKVVNKEITYPNNEGLYKFGKSFTFALRELHRGGKRKISF